MSTFPERPNAALLVIDVQNDVVAESFERNVRIANINSLVNSAREKNIEVIWVQHSDHELISGSSGWEIVSELVPQNSEPVIHKSFRSSFEATNLDEVLADQKIGHLVICGAQTNWCIRNTVHAAFERGYDVTLVSDAHTTSDEEWPDGIMSAERMITELNHSCTDYELPGRKVRAIEGNKVTF